MESDVPAVGDALGGTEPPQSGGPEPGEAAKEAAAPGPPAGAAEETPARLAPEDDRQPPPVGAAGGGQPEGSPSEEGPPVPASQSAPPVPACCGAPEDAPKPPPSPASPPKAPDFYCVKWISWKGERTPVIMQSENGPCPLLAIMNILFLQWKVKLPAQKEVVTSDELMAHLGDCILSVLPQDQAEAVQLNFQQNVNDAMTVLPKLSTGLDVNVRFTGVSDFEYTPECIVFDLLNVPLYHGWLVDPQTPEAAQAVSKLSYNQLVEKIITCKHSNDPNSVTEGLIAEQFLESTASQLTYHGLCELTSTVKEGELSVFFRNNHFSAMIKHKSHLYLLVTDQGFLNEDQVTWESLHNVDGDSCFCDANFHLIQALGKEAAGGSPVDQRQVDQDYMIALSPRPPPCPPRHRGGAPRPPAPPVSAASGRRQTWTAPSFEADRRASHEAPPLFPPPPLPGPAAEKHIPPLLSRDTKNALEGRAFLREPHPSWGGFASPTWGGGSVRVRRGPREAERVALAKAYLPPSPHTHMHGDRINL